MPQICPSSKHEAMLCRDSAEARMCLLDWNRESAGLMVDFASPKPLVHLVQNIYLYTQQDRRTYTFIYKETNSTAHMVHVHVLSRFTKSKQPYWLTTDSWVLNRNHQPITKIGRHAQVKHFWSMLPRYSPLHCRRENKLLHSHIVHSKS